MIKVLGIQMVCVIEIEYNSYNKEQCKVYLVVPVVMGMYSYIIRELVYMVYVSPLS